jgi:hypothetical protein
MSLHCPDILCGVVVEFPVTDPDVRVRFPTVSDLLRNTGSLTGPLSLVGKIEEHLKEKGAAPV